MRKSGTCLVYHVDKCLGIVLIIQATDNVVLARSRENDMD